MSLTTMTRMVEEDRGLIGTYLGLGYGGLAVSSRYLLFALLACLVGGGIGLLVGFLGIPAFLMVVIEGLYILPGVRLEYDWLYGSAGIVMFVVGVGVVTALACREEIRHTPAALITTSATGEISLASTAAVPTTIPPMVETACPMACGR